MTSDRAPAGIRPRGGTTSPGPRALLVPFVVGGGLAIWWAATDRAGRAVPLFAAITAVTVVRVVTRGRFDAAVARGARAVATALAAAIFGGLFVLVLVPVGLVRRVVVLVRAPPSGWQARAAVGEAGARWTFAPERPVGRTGWVGAAGGALLATFGWVVIIVAADLLVGTIWVGRYHEAPLGRRIVQETVAMDRIDRRPVVDLRTGPPSANVDRLSPAMAAYPWAAAYFREQDAMSAGSTPFELYEFDDARGDHINIADGVRRSYQPDVPPGTDLPEVVFYGGSTMFGQAQRDLHSVASEISRLAERDGLPIEVVNRGQRGWTSWQEFHGFEHRTSLGDRPDLAVFYDGANEAATNPGVYGDQPVEFDHERMARRFRFGDPRDAAGSTMSGLTAAVREEWRARSLADRAARYAGLVDAPEVAPASTEARTGGQVPEGPLLTALYERSRRMIRAVADPAGIPVVSFWQPQLRQSPGYVEAAAALAPETIDLTRALDGHEDVYLPDGAHTNEEGARLTAEAMWPHLRPQIQAWYDDAAS